MKEIDEIADVFKLLGDKTRLTIVAMLKEKELCVCEIVELLNTSQPNISQHMRKLKDGGLVKESKKRAVGILLSKYRGQATCRRTS